MGFGDIQGRARTNARSPSAKAVCDQCGEWYNLVDLREQVEYYGRSVKKTGYLVCRNCFDKPQPQLQPFVLPPDPVPVKNPRPENFFSDRGVAGYTQVTLWPPILQNSSASAKQAAIAQIASLSGIATPAAYGDLSLTVAKPFTTTIIAPKVATPRTWILFYNPGGFPIIISNGNAAFSGDPQAILLGPGNGLVQAGNGFTPGAVTCAVWEPGAPVWAFSTPAYLHDEGGNILYDEGGNAMSSP